MPALRRRAARPVQLGERPALSYPRELPLWRVDAPGRAAFAGDVMGTWLWLVLWPRTAGALLAKPLRVRDLRVRDLRDPGQELDLPFGAPSPQLPR